MARKIAELQRGHGVEIGTLKAVFQVGVRPYVTTRRAAWCACVHKLIRVQCTPKETENSSENYRRQNTAVRVYRRLLFLKSVPHEPTLLLLFLPISLSLLVIS